MSYKKFDVSPQMFARVIAVRRVNSVLSRDIFKGILKK